MVKAIDSATTIEARVAVASEAFYRGKFGFNAGKFYGEPPTFCIVWHDCVTILLDQVRAPHPIPLNQYGALYIYVHDVDAMYADVQRRSAAFARALEYQFCGCRDFDIRHPDGHLIGIGQKLTGKAA
jgi:catechol 2,3-dioxygenase-like lactoylglutathione lyase family enzyme